MKIQVNRMITLFVIFITISYTGAFAGYHGCMALICCFTFLFVLCLFTGLIRINVKSCSPIWPMLLLYLCLNSLLNIPKSFLYIILFSGGLFVMLREINAKEIQFTIKLFKIIAIILAASILLQVYLPKLFYDFASRWFFYSNQYDMLCHLGIVCHQYSGLFYEVSFSGLILSLGCIICFVEFNLKKHEKIINFLLGAVMYYSVILTGKRSFILIVPALLFIFWLFGSYKQKNLVRFVTLGILIFLLIWQSNTILELISNILTKGQGNMIQLSSREHYWELALKMFRKDQLFGQGLNSFDIVFNMSGIKKVAVDFAGAHNAYFQLLAETGMIGALLYLSAILGTVFRGIGEVMLFRKNKEKHKMMYSIISVLALLLLAIYGVSGNVLHQPQQVFIIFLFLGVIMNLNKISESDFKEIQKVRIVLK